MHKAEEVFRIDGNKILLEYYCKQNPSQVGDLQNEIETLLRF